MSRHHSRLVVEGDDATIEDLGSTNGTVVEGRRSTTATGAMSLVDGLEIRLGQEVLRFAAVNLSTETDDDAGPIDRS